MKFHRVILPLFALATALHAEVKPVKLKKFVWADANIKGDQIMVSSKNVPHPAAVCYAWSNKFIWANLFNQDWLPAQPFRTDQW